MSEEVKTAVAFHWLTVGYVSPGAEKWITEAGGQVKQVNSDPALVAVALAYNPEGTWTWSHGRQEHRQGIEFWNTGELQEASTGITLQYGSSSDPRGLAEYCSTESNYLLLPDEEFDAAARKVKEEPATKAHEPAVNEPDELVDDLSLDDCPF